MSSCSCDSTNTLYLILGIIGVIGLVGTIGFVLLSQHPPNTPAGISMRDIERIAGHL